MAKNVYEYKFKWNIAIHNFIQMLPLEEYLHKSVAVIKKNHHSL